MILVFVSLSVFSILTFCQRAPQQEDRAGSSGVTDTEVLIGSSCALTGHANFLGTSYVHGAMCYINHINEKGGIHGRKIRVIVYDDGYDPPRCVFNTQKLINDDKVFALFCYVGTPTSVEIIPIVEEARIPLLGLFTGANTLRNPFRKYIFNVRASYYQEIAATVYHLVKDRGLNKFAVFYQYDAYGFDGLTGAELALKKYKFEPIARGSYVRGTMDVEESLGKIVASGAQVVIMVGTYDPCAKFIKLARAKGFNPIFYNVSFVGGDELARKLGPDGEGVIVTQVVPSPDTRALLPRVDQYWRLLEKYYPGDQPNYVGLEGFINARVLIRGLKLTGKDLDRQGFIEALESVEEYSLGIGRPLNFGRKDHEGLDAVYFSQIRDGKLVLVMEWDL
ncbi:MAG: ABC transporter substrate-binding protein [Desulfobacterales bacterium]|nr:ABC transporter substrate-binding protein [Desulfobacterales bacterium]